MPARQLLGLLPRLRPQAAQLVAAAAEMGVRHLPRTGTALVLGSRPAAVLRMEQVAVWIPMATTQQQWEALAVVLVLVIMPWTCQMLTGLGRAW
jgi:hypothetical protein